MLRIGLCLYLVFVVAAGPALCCCTTRHLMAKRAETDVQAVQPARHTSSCCHHAADKEQSHPAQPGHPTPSRCPCQDQQSQFLPSLLANADDARQLLSKQLLPALPPLSLDLPLGLSLSTTYHPATCGEATTLPFLSAQDLLRALHNLRC